MRKEAKLKADCDDACSVVTTWPAEMAGKYETGKQSEICNDGYSHECGMSPGTRVQLKDGKKQRGVVMPYMRECLQGMLGLFPVRLDNAIWQICNTSDVIVLEKDTD